MCGGNQLECGSDWDYVKVIQLCLGAALSPLAASYIDRGNFHDQFPQSIYNISLSHVA